MTTGALAKYRVLDLSRDVAGPYCTRLMAALGADVIKVEKPGEGDPSRRVGPFKDGIPDPETSVLFLYLNAGKKSVTLNLESPRGRDILRALARDADVLVESFRPGYLPSLRLGYEALREVNHGLVMTSVTPFGQTGPYRDYQANELVLYALGGLMSLTGDSGAPPLVEGGNVTQYIAGQTAFVATTGALFGREVTGEGRYVDLSIMEHAVSDEEYQWGSYQWDHVMTRRSGNHNPKGFPWGILPCRNGWVAIAATDDKWLSLVELIGNPALMDSRFASRQGRLDNKEELMELLLPWLMDRDKEEIFRVVSDRHIAAGMGHDMSEVAGNEHLNARGFFAEVAHPIAGTLRMPGAPWRLSRTPAVVGPPPLLGQHNQQVLGGILGYGQDDLERLSRDGVI